MRSDARQRAAMRCEVTRSASAAPSTRHAPWHARRPHQRVGYRSHARVPKACYTLPDRSSDIPLSAPPAAPHSRSPASTRAQEAERAEQEREEVLERERMASRARRGRRQSVHPGALVRPSSPPPPPPALNLDQLGGGGGVGSEQRKGSARREGAGPGSARSQRGSSSPGGRIGSGARRPEKDVEVRLTPHAPRAIRCSHASAHHGVHRLPSSSQVRHRTMRVKIGDKPLLVRAEAHKGSAEVGRLLPGQVRRAHALISLAWGLDLPPM